METANLNFECTHDQANRTMTCSWLGGCVRLVHHFAMDRTYCLVDGTVKCRYSGLTVGEFVRLQRECQRAADGMTLK